MTVQLAALHPEQIERSAFAENSRSALEVKRSLIYVIIQIADKEKPAEGLAG